MADQPDTINLDENVFDENNSERRSWNCIGHSCSRSLIVPLPHFFCFTANHSGKLLKNTLSYVLRQENVWAGNLCSTAAHIIQTPRLRTNFHEKPCFQFLRRSRRVRKITTYQPMVKERYLPTKFCGN